MPIPYTNTGTVDCTIVPDLKTLKDKSVIVTGGSSGIGAAYVKAFLNAGAFVTNADIHANDGETVATSYGFVQCDVRQWKDQVAVFKHAIASSPHHSVDIVIANAGIAGEDTLYELDDDDEPTEPDLKIVDVNYKGVLYTAKLAMHYFNKQPISLDRDRCLVITASLAGYLDPVGVPLYQTSKFAVRGLMCNLRRSDRLRVNVIAPLILQLNPRASFVDTPILGEFYGQAVRKLLAARHLDFALPEDCAKAALRIATDTSINGRAFGIVPRQLKPEGYVDLDHDSPKEGSILSIFELSGDKTLEATVVGA